MSSFLCDDKFIGIKYTSNDFFTLEQCKANFPDKIVYNGFDEMFMAGLSMGADGGIGFDFGHCRKPFGVPSAEEKAVIAKEISYCSLCDSNYASRCTEIRDFALKNSGFWCYSPKTPRGIVASEQ